MRWRAPWRCFIDAADRVGLVALQEPRRERRERSFLLIGRESGAGMDAVGCEGIADVSMAAYMFARCRRRRTSLLDEVAGTGVGSVWRRKAYSEA